MKFQWVRALPDGSAEYSSVGKICNFQPIIRRISEKVGYNLQDSMVIVTMKREWDMNMLCNRPTMIVRMTSSDLSHSKSALFLNFRSSFLSLERLKL